MVTVFYYEGGATSEFEGTIITLESYTGRLIEVDIGD